MANLLDKPNLTLKELEFYLLVLLYPADSGVRKDIVQRTDIEGTTSVLISHDLTENTVTLINTADVKKWGFAIDDLFAIGLRNTFRMFPVTYHKDFKLQSGAIMWDTDGRMFESTGFTATSMLNQKTFPEVGKYGSLVILPSQFVTGVLPIEDYHALAAIDDMAHLAQATYNGVRKESKKFFVSPFVYWYYEGKFKIVAEINEKDKLYIRPDEQFVTIIEKIGGDVLKRKLTEKIFFWPEIFTEVNGKAERLLYVDTNEDYANWAGRILPGQTIEEGIATELADTLHYKGNFEYKIWGPVDEALDKKGQKIKRYKIRIKLLDKLSSTKTKFGWDIVLK